MLALVTYGKTEADGRWRHGRSSLPGRAALGIGALSDPALRELRRPGSCLRVRDVRRDTGVAVGLHRAKARADNHRMRRSMINRVPEVTVYFWVIKVCATTVGESVSDYLSDTRGLGLP